MQTHGKICPCSAKVNINFFFGEPKLPLLPLIGPSPYT